MFFGRLGGYRDKQAERDRYRDTGEEGVVVTRD